MYTHNGLYEQDETICKISINPLRNKIAMIQKMKIFKKNVFDFYLEFHTDKKLFNNDNTTLLYTEISERKKTFYMCQNLSFFVAIYFVQLLKFLFVMHL